MWFYTSSDGVRYFNLPAFFLKGGRAKFINGRHRTALLLDHLELLPMALTQMDDESAAVLERIVQRALNLGEVLNLPDLPVLEGHSKQEQALGNAYPLTLSFRRRSNCTAEQYAIDEAAARDSVRAAERAAEGTERVMYIVNFAGYDLS